MPCTQKVHYQDECMLQVLHNSGQWCDNEVLFNNAVADV